MKSIAQPALASSRNTSFLPALLALMALFLSAFAPEVLAQATLGGGTLADTQGTVSSFVCNLQRILVFVSIAIVTIAIIMAGYQIAFAHKRIADVAPILIGGLLIGAASQIASMLIGGTNQCLA